MLGCFCFFVVGVFRLFCYAGTHEELDEVQELNTWWGIIMLQTCCSPFSFVKHYIAHKNTGGPVLSHFAFISFVVSDLTLLSFDVASVDMLFWKKSLAK